MSANEKKEVQKLYSFTDIIGSCPKFLGVKELGKRASTSDFPVLISGESGTGKELLAQSIHQASTRSDQSFIAVNCSAIPESLIESELFGYERGAFTGAKAEGSVGKFEAAHMGTIFLDEIGDMSPRAQATLLRVLQERTITPIGTTKTKKIDVRVISATHKDLLEEAKAGRFREDLYYRLKGIGLTLPPLRDRADIIELAYYLLKQINGKTVRLTKEACNILIKYRWPGNIRELQCALIQASFLSEGKEITAEHLPVKQYHIDEYIKIEKIIPLKTVEKEAILKALYITNWNITKTAQLLNISRNKLYRKINEHGLFKNQFS